MIKMLGYESMRMNKDTMIIMNHDATADFDQMYHEYGNMLDAKKNVNRAICECMSGTTERAMRNVETGLGLPEITYKSINGEKKMTGEIQGKASVPQHSNLQKDQMIHAHNELSAGVELHTPDTKSKIKHHRVTFVDDRTGHVAGDPDKENTTRHVRLREKCTTERTRVVQPDTTQWKACSVAQNYLASNCLGSGKWRTDNDACHRTHNHSQRW